MDKDIYNYNIYRKNLRGAAIIEFLASLLFIIPLLVNLPVIAKYISVKYKNIESGRYAIWERTVWSSELDQWQDNENVKLDSQLENELDVYFYGNELQGMANSKLTRNMLWVDFNSETIIETKNEKRMVTLKSAVDYSPVKNEFADEIAYGRLNYSVNNQGKIADDCIDVAKGSNISGLNIGARSFSAVEVTAKINNIINSSDIKDTKSYRFKFNGAILSNAWTAPMEDEFKKRVVSLSLSEQVKCIVQPAKYLSRLPLYREGLSSDELGEWDLSVVSGTND